MDMPPALLSLHHHVSNVNLHPFTDQTLEHASDHSLIRSLRILWPERHHCVMVISLGHNKRSFLQILGGQNDLMAALKGVQKAYHLVSDCSIHQLIYLRH